MYLQLPRNLTYALHPALLVPTPFQLSINPFSPTSPPSPAPLHYILAFPRDSNGKAITKIPLTTNNAPLT